MRSIGGAPPLAAFFGNADSGYVWLKNPICPACMVVYIDGSLVPYLRMAGFAFAHDCMVARILASRVRKCDAMMS